MQRGMDGVGSRARGRATRVRCASCGEVIATLAPGESVSPNGVERTVSCKCGTRSIRVSGG